MSNQNHVPLEAKKPYILTVYIGRFSPFHLGHAAVIDKALAESDELLILIGSSDQALNTKNPFPFYHRRQLITGYIHDKYGDKRDIDVPVRMVSLQDYPYNDSKWISKVRDCVDFTIGDRKDNYEIRITGADRDESCWYLHAFPDWKQSFIDHPNHDFNLSATEIRKYLFEGLWGLIRSTVPKVTYEFLLEWAKSDTYKRLKEEYEFLQAYKKSWESAPYPPTFVTVDAVVLHSTHVLAVKRRGLPGKGLWALPGGFVNQNERLKDACLRELSEETGLKIPEKVLRGSMTATEVFDHPGRSLRGRTITHAYLIQLEKIGPLPKVKGGDDAEKAFWIPLDEALDKPEMWFEDHHAIIETMIGRSEVS